MDAVDGNHLRDATVPEALLEPAPNSQGSDAVVPMVRVYLIQPVRVAPRQSLVVPVQMEEGWYRAGPLFLQQDEELLSLQLSADEALLQPDANRRCHAVLTNLSGSTQHLEPGKILGQVEQVEVEEVPSTEAAESLSVTLNVTSFAESQPWEEVQRKEKLKQALTEPDLPDEEKCALLDFLASHHDVFSLGGERGETDLIEMEIDTGDALPRRQSARKMAFAVRQQVAKQLYQMQRNGVIEPSKSPWASPVVLVRKRDRTHRFCVDYRPLNSVTKPDSFPLPRIEDLLDQL